MFTGFRDSPTWWCTYKDTRAFGFAGEKSPNAKRVWKCGANSWQLITRENDNLLDFVFLSSIFRQTLIWGLTNLDSWAFRSKSASFCASYVAKWSLWIFVFDSLWQFCQFSFSILSNYRWYRSFIFSSSHSTQKQINDTPIQVHTGWWFGTFLFFHILRIIIPND